MSASAGHPEDMFGEALPIVKDLGIGPTMAARVVGDTLYTIGRGKLRTIDIATADNPTVVGTLSGLGNTRQIAVKNGVAYVTSREDGVFIVDVRTPDTPALLCHYDPIEVATGIDVSGDVMFVACRGHGVELVDVSNPRKPRHLSTARTGEAQSVGVQNGYAYVGVWGNSELVVVDARNAREPRINARCRLDGFGDGVAVRGKYVYVATGHHSRDRRTWSPKPGDPGYGCGHGLEIYDIADPAKPVFVSRIKTPPFYAIGNDMWGVKLAGDHAFVADTYNGVFVVNVKNPRRPFFVAHRQLPYVLRRGSRFMRGGKLPGFVGGLALGKDHIYVAGGWTDLHVVAAPGLAKPCRRRPGLPPDIPPFKPRRSKRFRIYQPEGQVRAVDFMGDTAVIATGSGGIQVVQVWPQFKLLGGCETKGFAMEVTTAGDHVYVAEEKGGLSIWQKDDNGGLDLVGRYQPRGHIVRDIVVPKRGKYAIAQVDLSILDFLDVSDPTEPRRVFRDKGLGFVYHIGRDLIDSRQVCVLWQLGGLRWYDLYSGPEPKLIGEYAHRLGGAGTIPHGDGRLVIYRGGFVAIDPTEERAPGELALQRIPKCGLGGKPLLADGKLHLSSRTTGDVTIVDLADPAKPKLVEQFNVHGNPGRLVKHNGALMIPNGYEGLWVERTGSSAE